MQPKKLTITFTLIVVLIIGVFCFKTLYKSNKLNSSINIDNSDGVPMSFNISAREEWEFNRLKDPHTGDIPADIRRKELDFAKTLPHTNIFRKSGELWEPIGPYNVGGRTRTFAIDITNEDILIAGGNSGGIWRSDNAGKTWTKTTKNNQPVAISSITQDPRNGKTNIWYATTGEVYGSSASKAGASFDGNGFLKSTDGGNTWFSLLSTVDNNVEREADFDGGWNILVNHTIKDKDVVFAAVRGGIYRSLNGGDTWQKILGLTEIKYSDIAITTDGTLYAAIGGNKLRKGIWRSDDNGDNWTNITAANFPSSYNRLTLATVPSENNQIYVLASNTNSGDTILSLFGVKSWNALFKYTYISGDGSGAGGSWEDRSTGLPTAVNGKDGFNSQGGYCQLIKVHPTDTNIMVVGGTSLFYTTDAFRSRNNTKQIGGYVIGTILPDFKIYKNHHPDQHVFVFFPSNPNKAISAHDGGISVTQNVKADKVEWEFINNGYTTTQFYTVAINQSKAGDNTIIGGLQDNGTLFTNKYDRKNPWNMIFSYDGGYCHVADNGKDYYVSKQISGIYRIQLDGENKRVASARIDPINQGLIFINPWCVNPNNDKQMYLPVFGANGVMILRNNDVTQQPLDTVLNSTPNSNSNWDSVAFFQRNWEYISAISMSIKPANTLFYGTTKGHLFKVENANAGQPPAIDITPPTSLDESNIGNICVHPEDADKLVVVATNYGVKSLFYTDDGGLSWTDISGNLEENIDGTGNGPSCRWAAFVKTESGYGVLVATSIGLFGTPILDGTNTVWIQQDPDGIGNAVCEMIKVRQSDNKVVVATHGSGVYIANLSRSYQLTGLNEEVSTTKQVVDFNLYPNPAQGELNISITDNAFKTATISIYNINGQKLIEEKSTNSKTKLLVGMLAQGTYLLRVSTAKGNSSKIFIKR